MKNKQFVISENCNFPGVYIILNLNNKKIYIGSSRNVKRRLIEHEINLRGNKHTNKIMQSDYNSGDKFIGYPITRVELLKNNSYSKDDNLRFFEYKAIVYFNSDNPEKGYNKRADKKESREINDIEWAKRRIDDYFWSEEMMKHPKRQGDKEYYKSEMEKFISSALNK